MTGHRSLRKELLKRNVIIVGGSSRVRGKALGESWRFSLVRVERIGGRAFRIGRDCVVIYGQVTDQPRAVAICAQGFLSPHRAQLRETSGTKHSGRIDGRYGDEAKA